MKFNLMVFGAAHIKLLVVLSFLVVVGLVYQFVWHHLHQRSLKTNSLLDTSFLNALHYPFYGLLGLFAFQVLLPFVPDSIFEIVGRVREDFNKVFSVGFTVFVLLVFNRFLSHIQQTIVNIEKNKVMDNSHAWVSACKFGRFLSILAFLLVTLSFFEIPMGQILAPTAIGALALSFASKDVLSNVFGGVMVLCDRPFSVGDYVKIANTDEGTVRYIGWRMTEVALRNGRILHVPNGLVTTSTVTNYSEKTHWFVQKEIGIRYQDLPVAKDIASAIEQWVNEHVQTNQRRVSFARVFNFSDSSVTIRVRVYLKSSINTKQWYIFTEELLMKVCEVVNSHGADFAFPTRTVVMDGQSTEQVQ